LKPPFIPNTFKINFTAAAATAAAALYLQKLVLNNVIRQLPDCFSIKKLAKKTRF
jgi:hypothetical protein